MMLHRIAGAVEADIVYKTISTINRAKNKVVPSGYLPSSTWVDSLHRSVTDMSTFEFLAEAVANAHVSVVERILAEGHYDVNEPGRGTAKFAVFDMI